MRKAIASIFLVVAVQILVVGQAQQAPPVVLKDLTGRTVRIDAFKGKVVMLNFWATWCPPCRAEMPGLIKWQREFQEKGLQVVGITYPPTKVQDVRQFTRRIKVNYPILLGSKETKALFDSSEIMPVTIIIDRNGMVKDRIEGIILPEEFEQKVKPLLN
ncbi:MAG TPA: TlpA disulfide reductase family protein [Pyrinomonadaceae bacterium]|nr:TlpA disulfide reductase family protein [Pyrinomonadaceae bacterium]